MDCASPTTSGSQVGKTFLPRFPMQSCRLYKSTKIERQKPGGGFIGQTTGENLARNKNWHFETKVLIPFIFGIHC